MNDAVSNNPGGSVSQDFLHLSLVRGKQTLSEAEGLDFLSVHNGPY